MKFNRKRCLLLVILALAPLLYDRPAGAASYEFTTIDVPDAIATLIEGINDHGQVVGGYIDTEGGSHGFLYSDGDVAVIDVPDSVSTIVFGINNQERLVGSHVADGQHGFDYKQSRKRVFKPLDVPFTTGVILTRPNDVNNHGLIVGEYLDNPLSNEQHGFLADHGEFISIDVPDALITSASGINDAGKIVGFFEDNQGLHGFIRENDSFTTLDVSFDGGFSTVALGINNADQIVGIYQTSTGTHGFVYEDGKYTRFDVPGALDTVATGINRHGDIAGFYQDAIGTHGFIALKIKKPAKGGKLVAAHDLR